MIRGPSINYAPGTQYYQPGTTYAQPPYIQQTNISNVQPYQLPPTNDPNRVSILKTPSRIVNQSNISNPSPQVISQG